jgi:hypothetical protein
LEGDVTLALSESIDIHSQARNKLIDLINDAIPKLFSWTHHYGYFMPGSKEYYLSYCRIFDKKTDMSTGMYSKT